MKRNPYDRMAYVYDPMSKILGSTYLNSKYLFLEEIEAGDKVLYLGGGTGINLPFIVKKVGASGKVIYMESSAEMIKMAKKRIPVSLLHRVKFLQNGDFSEIPNEKYDKVLTQYFLDILPNKEIDQLFQCIDLKVEENAGWIFLDFFEVKEKKLWLRTMIGFFRIFAGNPRKDLPEYFDYFAAYGWDIKKEKSFKNGFIRACLLEK